MILQVSSIFPRLRLLKPWRRWCTQSCSPERDLGWGTNAVQCVGSVKEPRKAETERTKEFKSSQSAQAELKSWSWRGQAKPKIITIIIFIYIFFVFRKNDCTSIISYKMISSVNCTFWPPFFRIDANFLVFINILPA